jgi:hypothetical protein
MSFSDVFFILTLLFGILSLCTLVISKAKPVSKEAAGY